MSQPTTVFEILAELEGADFDLQRHNQEWYASTYTALLGSVFGVESKDMTEALSDFAYSLEHAVVVRITGQLTPPQKAAMLVVADGSDFPHPVTLRVLEALKTIGLADMGGNPQMSVDSSGWAPTEWGIKIGKWIASATKQTMAVQRALARLETSGDTKAALS